VTVWTRELAGAFPEYRDLIEPQGTARVRVQRAALVRAAVRAAAFAGTRDVAVRFCADSVTIRPLLLERAEAVCAPVLPAQAEGLAAPLELRFDPALLAAAVQSIRTEWVVIHPAAGRARTVLAEEGVGGARCVLVPHPSRREARSAVAPAA
jgi:hypothetical protein